MKLCFPAVSVAALLFALQGRVHQRLVWTIGPAVSSRQLGWFWNLKNGSWDPFLVIDYLRRRRLSAMTFSSHRKHLCEKQDLMLDKLLDFWHPFGLASDTHGLLDYCKILCEISYVILESSISGHLVVLNPSKLIHLIIPFGQKCRKYYLSRFQNSSSLFLHIIALHCVCQIR